MDPSGLVTAVAQGTVAIAAAAGSISGEARVNVVVDEAALVALYEAAGGPSWSNRGGWLTDAPLEEWHGVETDTSGRVTELNLAANNLAGSLPPELGNLASLTVLLAYGNDLQGTIPPELGNLANLTQMDLGDNSFSGSIPPELGGLDSLTLLSLRSNGLSGTILPELGNLARLTILSLHTNGLTGAIPESFLRLARLEVLALRNTLICVPGSAAFTAWLGGLFHDTGKLSACGASRWP